MSEDPDLEGIMLARFIEAAQPSEILRWQRAHTMKTVRLSLAVERERCVKFLNSHGFPQAAVALEQLPPAEVTAQGVIYSERKTNG